MRRFDATFRETLRSRVELAEARSGAELVATVLPRLRGYFRIDLILASFLSFLVLTVMFFIETEIHYVLIYFETVGTFFLVFLFLFLFPSLKRWLIGKQNIRSVLELRSKALFLDAQIMNTSNRIGVLFVFAFYERQSLVLPDEGIEELVPPDEWERIHAICQSAMEANDMAQAILDAIEECGNIFSQYVPRPVDKVNELPDELWT